MTDNRTTSLKVALSTMNKEGYRASIPAQGHPEIFTLFYTKDGVNRVMYFKKSEMDLETIATEVKALLNRTHEEQLEWGPQDFAFKETDEQFIGH